MPPLEGNSGWSSRIKLHLFDGNRVSECGHSCARQRVSRDTMRACLQTERVVEGPQQNGQTVELWDRAGRVQVKEVGLGANRIQEMSRCLTLPLCETTAK